MEREQIDDTNYKKHWFFLPQKREIWNLGLKLMLFSGNLSLNQIKPWRGHARTWRGHAETSLHRFIRLVASDTGNIFE